MKVIVGFPPTPTDKGTPLLSQNRQFQYFDNPTFLFPVALGTAATMLRDLGHYDVLWEDAIAQQDSEEKYFEMLEKEKPDFYFFETKAPVVKAHWAAITKMKKRFPNMKIVICGDHVTFAPRETMENSPVDYLVCGGYYDFAILELIQALEKNKPIPVGVWYRKNGKIVDNGRYELKRPLDDAPIIDRKLTKNDLYQKEFNLKGRPLAYIMSGRDCWYGKCTFCFHPSTNVLTENGIKEIKDIQLGEKILTHEGAYSENNMIFKRSYSGKMIVITSSSLPAPIRCTPNHKLFTIKRNKSNPTFVEASGLEIGDTLVSPLIENHATTEVLEKAFNEIAINSISQDGNNLFLVQNKQLSSVLKTKGNRIIFEIDNLSSEEYTGYIYNMSIPGDNTYTANLVSVSNCVWDQTLYPKGNFRVRTPENVMKEVKYLVDECGVKEIFDDCGTITVGKWLKDFCKLMIDSGYNKKVMYSCNMRFGAVNLEEYKMMKAAGFRLLKYGLESGNQFTIDKLDKGTKIPEVVKSCREAKEAGLTVHLTMMVGYPWETKKDAMETVKLSKYLMRKGYADVLQSTVMVPYPGTPLWREGMEKNWFRFNPYDYERFDMAEPVFKTPDMTPQEVQGMCRKIYNVFWNPEYIMRHLMKIKSWEDVKYTLKGVRAVVGHMFDFSRSVKEE